MKNLSARITVDFYALALSLLRRLLLSLREQTTAAYLYREAKSAGFAPLRLDNALFGDLLSLSFQNNGAPSPRKLPWNNE